ncbi:MAG: transglycosylase SLT domain-containing protein [Pseudomonadota bacterium]
MRDGFWAAVSLAIGIVFGLADYSRADPSLSALPYHSLISKYAVEHGIPVKLAHAVVKMESDYQPDIIGARGEVGLMQIAPKTARGIGYRGPIDDLHKPEVNLRWGMRYLAMAYKRGDGDVCHTVMRYQSGLYAKRYSPSNARYCGKVKEYLAAL